MRRYIVPVVLAVAVNAAGWGQAGPAYAGVGSVDNGGFEDASGPTPPSWQEAGDVDASFAEGGGKTGWNRLSHWAATGYQVTTSQTVTGLSDGTYTLHAAVRTSGGQNAAYLSLSDCGGPEARVEVPRTGDNWAGELWWVQVVLRTEVTAGQCTINIVSDANAGNWLNVDDVSLIPTVGSDGAAPAIAGADVSQLSRNQFLGAVYRDAADQVVDPLQLLAASNVNYARLKVWVSPANGYSSKADVLRKAKAAKAAGMKLLIDFHYSDSWADPGKQNKPAAWANYTFGQLEQAVYDHTYSMLSALRAQHTPADMVQVGNEINSGLLWPEGKNWDSWDGTAALLKRGVDAVHADGNAKVVLHRADDGSDGDRQWWFDKVVEHEIPFDIIAVSHYTYWHGPLGYLQHILTDLTTRYDKPVMVVETAYGFTLTSKDPQQNIFNSTLESAGGWPATPQGQADALRDMVNVVAAVPNALGVFYWEPTWTAVKGGGWDPANPASGNEWENQALFDFTGKALPALSAFRHS